MLRKIIIIIFFLWLTAMDVYGGEYICSWAYDEDYNIKYIMEEIELDANLSIAEKIILIFDKFFNQCNNDRVSLIPKGTKFIDATIDNGHLNLYVSSDIKSYGGGCAWESALVKGILDTSFAIDEVEDVTLYIGGKIDFLPEGIIIDSYRRENYLSE